MYFFTSNDERGLVYVFYPLVRAITMVGLIVAEVACARAGHVTSGIIFLTFLLQVTCGAPELYAWIERMFGGREHFDSLHTKTRCVAFIIWFCAVTAETMLLCFAKKRAEPLSDDPNYSPELDSSFLNRITLW